MLVIYVIVSGLTFLSTVQPFNYNIYASVMGRLGSQEIKLYRQVADILMSKESYENGSTNHCLIHLNELLFDMTNGSTVYESLTKARANFEDNKVAVAIGPHIDVFTSTNYVILNRLHLLTSASSEVSNKVVPILPQAKSMSSAIADIVRRLGWRNVALLAQDDFSPVLTLGSLKIKVWPIRLPPKISSENDPELRRNLIQLRSSQEKKFILHSNKRDVINYVMRAAKHLHLLHYTIDWFVTYPDFEDIIKEQSGRWPGSLYGLQLLRNNKIPANVSGLQDVFNISRLDLGLAVDVVGILRHVLWSNAHDCSRGPMGGNFNIYSDIFKTTIRDQTNPYHGALGQYIWQNDDNIRTNYSIDVLWYNSTVNQIGTCTFLDGKPLVDFTVNKTKNPSRDFVFGKDDLLRVVTKQDDPFVMLRNGEYIGFNIDLLKHLAEKLHFTYEIFDVTNKKYKNNQNGQLIGLVQELINGNASMAIGALEVTAQREEVVSFSYTILSSKASLLIKKGESTRNFFQFLGPFSTGLWLMIMGFVVAAGLIMYIMSRYDQTQSQSEKRFNLKESMWYSVNILLQGTTDYSPQTTSTRTIISFFWFCVLVIDAAYTANLAAYLTLQQIDNRIRTVYDLSGQTTTLYGLEKDSSIMHFFKEQKEDPYERMWAFMKLNEEEALLTDKNDIIDRVAGGKFAFIADGVVNDYYAQSNCDIESVEQHFGGKDYSLGLPRGAPYRDDINRALLELKEEGVLDGLKEKWWSAGSNCSDEGKARSISDKTTAELQIENMFGVFLVLSGFVVLAIVWEIIDRINNCRVSMKKPSSKPPSEEILPEYKPYNT